jgi:hypothetical protein
VVRGVRAPAILIGAGLALTLAPAVVADDVSDEPEADRVVRPIGDGAVLVPADAEWSYRSYTAPRLDHQIGAVALSGLDLMAGRRAAAETIWGTQVTVPEGWPLALDGGAPGKGPFAIPGKDGTCACTTALPITDDDRVSALYAMAKFTLDADHADLRVLELRLRYRDGVALWLNGIEVARRGIEASPQKQLATRARGPEWEIFRIPVAPGLLRAGTNQLAIEARPSGRSRAPSLEAELVGRRKHGIARGPMIQRVAATSATVVIETELVAPATLTYGQGHAMDKVLESPPGRRHEFELAGLEPRSLVSYRIEAGDDRTPDHRFHTAPGAGELVRIAAYGDVRGGHAIHRSLVEAIKGEAPDMVLATGDMVLRGTDEGDWQRFFGVTEDLLPSTPYYPAIGNHDVGRAGDQLRRADQLFALPPAPAGRPGGSFWYSYDVGDVHLVFLDSNAYERSEQVAWLEQDLAAARKRKVRSIVVATHDGPYSRGSHRGNTIAQRDYVPILARYKIDLILSGHDHDYQRGQMSGIDYIVSGGGGASLYPQSCGLPGKRKCKTEDGMLFFAKEHHYVMVTIDKRTIETCPRRADGSAVEPCTKRTLKR